jgi:uncharacterized lipoprotein YajG
LKELTMLRFAALLTLIALASGCAVTPQKAILQTHVDYARSDDGKSRQVSVQVVDERDNTDLGHRGAANIGAGGKISTDQNVAELVRDAVFDGLKAKGFTPVNFNKSVDRQLQVAVRSINYATSTGFWTGGIETKAALKAHASVPNKEYDKLYRIENEERVVVVPTADHNTQLLNKALSDVLAQMFDDPALVSTLASN